MDRRSLADRALSPLRWRFAAVEPHAAWLPDWEALNRQNFDTPLLAAHMLLPALKHFGTGRLRVATGRRDARVVAMAIVLPTSSKFKWAAFQPPQLPISALIMQKGERLDDVAMSLLHALPWTALAFFLSQLDSDLFAKASDAAHLEVKTYIETGTITLPEPPADYFASRPASLRQNIAKRTRRATVEIGEPRLEVLESADAVDAYLALYSSTEASGWKGRANSAVRVDDRQGAFYRDMLTQAAAAGEARMFTLKFGSVPVAQLIAIEHAGVLYLMKTTYDERYKALAPGVLQRMHVLQWAAARSTPIRRAEIYGRLNESQRPFITGSREIFQATYFRHRVVRWFRDAIRARQREQGSSIPSEASGKANGAGVGPVSPSDGP
jgi:CelD/BcsL family acetyltransferase involved in cellulose biosynthesis